MEPRTIQIDGIPTVIRAMGEDYVVGEDPSEAGVEYAIKCWYPGKADRPTAAMAAYFRKIMKAYGTSAITAWQDKALVGFLPFMPLNCGMPEMVFCLYTSDQTPLERVKAATPIPFDQLSPKVLKVQCASIAHNRNMYRKGLGSTMANYLIDWARESGWERIEGWTFSDSQFFDAYKWLPSIHFWEKAGFAEKQRRIEDMDELGKNILMSDFEVKLT
ncbi:MAG: N-acetyltransferase family protein [Phycisphaerae bacterium]